MEPFQFVGQDAASQIQLPNLFTNPPHPFTILQSSLTKLSSNSAVKQTRKKLHIERSQMNEICAQDPRLPSRTVKTILKKFLARNSILVNTRHSLVRKELRNYIKKAQLVKKSDQLKTNDFGSHHSFERAEFTRFKRNISESKYLRHLILTDIPNLPPSCLKQIQKLTDLTSLELLVKIVWFKESSIPLNFARLTNLKKLALHFDSRGTHIFMNQDKFGANFSKFCKNLSKSQQLENLEILSVQHIPIYRAIEILLSSLGALNIRSFNLVLYSTTNQFLQTVTVRNLLEKVDYLGFHYQEPSKIKHEKKHSKSLRFICTESMFGSDMSQIINSCPNLTTVSLEIPASVRYANSQLVLPRNLKILLSMKSNKGLDHEIADEIKIWNNILKKFPTLEEFEVSILDWGNQSFRELVQLHQMDCLKNLKSYSIRSTSRTRVVLRDLLSDLAQILEPLKIVETWQFAFDKVLKELEEPKFAV